MLRRLAHLFEVVAPFWVQGVIETQLNQVGHPSQVAACVQLA
jgi:hypothetical protein